MTSIAWHIRLKEYYKSGPEESTPGLGLDQAMSSNEAGKCIGTPSSESATKLDAKPLQDKHRKKVTEEEASNVSSTPRPSSKDATYKRHRSFSKGNREDDEVPWKISSPVKSIPGKTISKLASPCKTAHGKNSLKRSSAVQPTSAKTSSELSDPKLCSLTKHTDHSGLVKSSQQQLCSPSKSSSKSSHPGKGSVKPTPEKQKSSSTPQKLLSAEPKEPRVLISDDKQNGRQPSETHNNSKLAKRRAESDLPISGSVKNSDDRPRKLQKTEPQVNFQGKTDPAEGKAWQEEVAGDRSSIECKTKAEELSLSLAGGGRAVGKCERSADE